MKLLSLGLAWFIGIVAAAFLVAPAIIILAFGIPFTYEMKNKGVLTSTRPAKRYMVSFVILIVLFALASWGVWHFFPKYIWAYAVGLLFTIVPSLRRCGRTESNVTEFFQSNGRYLDQDALARYLAR